MSIFLVKFFITIFAVIILAEIAKRIHPNVAGILMGLPPGAAISMYFFAYENGTEFALSVIPWGIAGLSSTVVFALAYLCAGRACARRGPLVRIGASAGASLLAWAVFALLLRLIPMSLPLAAIIFGSAITANLLILRKLRRPVEKTQNRASSPG
ncbi:MAG: hypothetical protein FWG35_08585, partial [Spirochaetaceae bacterium]|nr:hypothetical protein [Spirochaetaceae bacterium]